MSLASLYDHDTTPVSTLSARSSLSPVRFGSFVNKNQPVKLPSFEKDNPVDTHLNNHDLISGTHHYHPQHDSVTSHKPSLLHQSSYSTTSSGTLPYFVPPSFIRTHSLQSSQHAPHHLQAAHLIRAVRPLDNAHARAVRLSLQSKCAKMKMKKQMIFVNLDSI